MDADGVDGKLSINTGVEGSIGHNVYTDVFIQFFFHILSFSLRNSNINF